MKLLLILMVPLFVFAQQKQKSLLRKIAGEEIGSAITFLPLGTHTNRDHLNAFETWFLGANYKSFGVAVFRNSFRDWVLTVGYKRAWNFTKNFSMLYAVGIMWGYKGKLSEVDGIPFRKTFLIQGPLNPVADLELDYKIYKKFSIHMVLTPLVILYGLQYNF